MFACGAVLDVPSVEWPLGGCQHVAAKLFVGDSMKYLKLFFAAVLGVFLTGCALSSGDSLLALPKPPRDYVALQEKIDKILETGAVQTAPEGGQNRQSVQLVDIDADGYEEAIAFFRTEPGAGRFKVCLYKKVDGEYIEMGAVEGTGTAIQSVSYPRFEANGACGVVLCWKLGSETKRGMTVATFDSGVFRTVLDTEYTDYLIDDIDGDSVDEILTLSDYMQGGRYSARVYANRDHKIKLLSEATLSNDIKLITKIHSGYVEPSQPAIFIDSSLLSMRGLVTDILVLKNDVLSNISIDTVAGWSESTYRPISALCSDPNLDGLIEVPSAKPMPGYNGESASDSRWQLSWQRYSLHSAPTVVLETYHDYTEGWYLEIPPEWADKITVVREISNGIRYTSFCEYGVQNVPLVHIYAFTGDDREQFASAVGFYRLGANQTTVFAASIPYTAELESELYLTEEEIAEVFHVIPSEW